MEGFALSWRPRRKMRRLDYSIFLSITLAISSGLITGCSSQPAATPVMQMGPVPVTITAVGERTVPVEVRGIGNVEALATVSVKALVAGTVEQVHFREGQDVQKGDLLFNLDERPFRATLAQLEANLARDEAELKNARSQAGRTEKLFQEAQAGQRPSHFGDS